MTDSSPYTPPAIWQWNQESGGKFANINRPIAGDTHEQELPVGKHPLQLYSLATPNGVKVTVMLEELLALGHSGAEYDAWLIPINEGAQFGSGFVGVNPNSKIPALLDCTDASDGAQPVRVFESGAILLYLAEKFGAFVPTSGAARAECLSWLFWQMGSAPFLGGGFGHFYAYAPTKIEYAINRYAMEAKRQMDVLNQRLATHEFLAGDAYTVADMAAWPWASSTMQRSFCRCMNTPTCCAGPSRLQSARRCSAAAWSTAPGATLPANCTSATMPAILIPVRTTSWHKKSRQGLQDKRWQLFK